MPSFKTETRLKLIFPPLGDVNIPKNLIIIEEQRCQVQFLIWEYRNIN